MATTRAYGQITAAKSEPAHSKPIDEKAEQARRERVHRVIDESVSRINFKPSQLFLVTGLLRK